MMEMGNLSSPSKLRPLGVLKFAMFIKNKWALFNFNEIFSIKNGICSKVTLNVKN